MKGKIGNKERLGHILDCIQEIEMATVDVDYEKFIANHVLRIAVVKWIEIIGEAANMIDKEIKERNTEIPWAKIIGLRHIVVHEYFGINFQIMWEIVTSYLPDFKMQVQNLYNEFE
jgi:uncharacterized protein with HEPN domain